MRLGKTYKLSEAKIDLTVKNLVKDQRFVFNFIKFYLYEYIKNLNEFYDQNREQVQELLSLLSNNQPSATLNHDTKEMSQNLQVLSFLFNIVDGFDIENHKINKEFLFKNFKLVANENEYEFKNCFKNASKFFKDVELWNKTMNCEGLYNQGNCLLWYALSDENKKRVIKDFILKDIDENLVENLKEKSYPYICEQIYKGAKGVNYTQEQI